MLSPALARLASPLYWAGLFIVRLYFSVRVKRGASIASHLVGFGVGVLASTGTALALALFGARFDSAPFAAYAPLALLLPLASGLFIGASYAFTLGMLTHFYEARSASRAAFTTAQCGVAGSVALPPLAGALIDARGLTAGIAFVFVTMCVFTVGAVRALKESRRWAA